jgi:hypothetical protein
MDRAFPISTVTPIRAGKSSLSESVNPPAALRGRWIFFALAGSEDPAVNTLAISFD